MPRKAEKTGIQNPATKRVTPYNNGTDVLLFDTVVDSREPWDKKAFAKKNFLYINKAHFMSGWNSNSKDEYITSMYTRKNQQIAIFKNGEMLENGTVAELQDRLKELNMYGSLYIFAHCIEDGQLYMFTLTSSGLYSWSEFSDQYFKAQHSPDFNFVGYKDYEGDKNYAKKLPEFQYVDVDEKMFAKVEVAYNKSRDAAKEFIEIKTGIKKTLNSES